MSKHTIEIPEPPVSKFLFSDTRMAWIWLPLRLYVGWEWLSAGMHKVTNPVWVGPQAGGAVKGFLIGSLDKTSGAHPDVSMWYGEFIKQVALPQVFVISHLVAIGELLVGVALILGMFTGIAAFFGAFMNMNYLLAGTISTNPVLLLIQLFLILAWRVAGFIGVDRFLLPYLGTPWQRGKIKKSSK